MRRKTDRCEFIETIQCVKLDGKISENTLHRNDHRRNYYRLWAIWRGKKIRTKKQHFTFGKCEWAISLMLAKWLWCFDFSHVTHVIDLLDGIFFFLFVSVQFYLISIWLFVIHAPLILPVSQWIPLFRAFSSIMDLFFSLYYFWTRHKLNGIICWIRVCVCVLFFD